LRLVNNRNGSLGGGILKRFTIFFDFQGSQILLKENGYFNDPFNYNMSGLEIQHAGVQWVKDELNRDSSSKNLLNVNDVVFDKRSLRYKFTLKPIFEIATIRKDSPAEKAGLLVGDVVLKIDGKNISNLTKQRIDQLLQAEDGKYILIEIERKGVKKKVTFQLKKIL
jgi:S1-C subfamily serine protease